MGVRDLMIAKFINPILSFGRTQREKLRRLEKPAMERMPSDMPAVTHESPVSDIKKIINGSVVTFEGTYQGKPIRVRIFNEAHAESKS
jgi:hypothetical protein